MSHKLFSIKNMMSSKNMSCDCFEMFGGCVQTRIPGCYVQDDCCNDQQLADYTSMTVLDAHAIKQLRENHRKYFKYNCIEQYALTSDQSVKYMLQNILDPPIDNTFTQYGHQQQCVMLLVEVLKQCRRRQKLQQLIEASNPITVALCQFYIRK